MADFIIRLGNHHGKILVVREDSKMIVYDIEEVLISYHYPGSLEKVMEQILCGTREKDWQTAFELFGFLEQGH